MFSEKGRKSVSSTKTTMNLKPTPSIATCDQVAESFRTSADGCRTLGKSLTRCNTPQRSVVLRAILVSSLGKAMRREVVRLIPPPLPASQDTSQPSILIAYGVSSSSLCGMLSAKAVTHRSARIGRVLTRVIVSLRTMLIATSSASMMTVRGRNRLIRRSVLSL